MSAEFIHLHVHSHFSLLNAIPKIPELISAAKKDGQTSLALTDDGNLYGAIEFYKTCIAEEIKPIIGVDFYVAPRTRHDKEHRIDNHTSRLVLLAKNKEGYDNLVKLVTYSNTEGFYYRARIDQGLIEKYSKDLIAILPSFASPVSKALKDNDEGKAAEQLSWYKSIFKEDLYLEITHHPEIVDHDQLQERIVSLSEKEGVPLVAAQDVYYMNKADNLAREVARKIHSGSPLMGDEADRIDDFSFITQKTAKKYFKKLPEALENTIKIAEKCNIELTLGEWIFPEYPKEENENYDEMLREAVNEGVKKRGIELDEVSKERIEYELGIITLKGFSPYFLVVSDLLKWAKKNGIYTNTRGSAAGSFVSYLIEIVNMNPLDYNLPFERFLNPERPSAPDVDMDIADNRRDDLIDYARERYGTEHVAQIGTFGTMAARAVVRDVARAMGYSYSIGDRIAKLIPFGAQGFPMTIDRAIELEKELKQAYKEDPETREIIDLAKKLEGNARHIGVHAAGVVISPKPVIEYSPLQPDPKGGKTITQYNMYSIADDYGGVGLLKFDFLGLKNLAVLADSIKRVKKIQNIEIDVDKMAIDDEKTFQMLTKGHTMGVFQMASAGMTRYLMELQPSTVHDINAMVALYRPGPMEFIPDYIARKRDPSKVHYIDPRMEKYLKPTFGILIYQDDVMLIAVELAGYSWGEADKFRKAMGKKIPAEMAKQKDKFRSGCIEYGMEEKVVQELWEMIETFAAYGFNKCLTGDTRIIDTTLGIPTTIKDLYKSKKTLSVQTLDDSIKIQGKKITNVAQNGIKDVFEITTRSGRTITATNNHPFKVFSGWKNVSELSTNERIATTRTISQPKKVTKIDSYKAATLGYLIAEGNLCHPHGTYYYSKDEIEIRDFIKNASKFKNAKITVDRSKSAASVYVGQTTNKNGNELFKWIKTLGLSGKKATSKFIPNEVFGYSNEMLSIFIGKLWQGDGSVDLKNTQIFYATSSAQLAKDLQTILLRFEILSTIHTKKFNYRGERKIGYTINISHRNNLIKFGESICKHLVGDKERKMTELLHISKEIMSKKEFLARGTKDTIPVEILEIIRSKMKEKGVSAKELSKRASVSEKLLYKNNKKRGYQRSIIKALGESLDSKEIINHATSDVFWDEVVSIEKKGKEMTYDLTVPPYHNFVANDFVVHNSHSVSYGNLAYRTAYMKANYPLEFMSALLTADSGDVDTISEIIEECKNIDIEILPPDINESYEEFSVVPNEKQIRFGLDSIKNFGSNVSHTIVEERKANGNYTDIENFLDRVRNSGMNRRGLEALIKSGAMDRFATRGVLLSNIELLLEFQKEMKSKPEGQDSLFGAVETSNTLDLQPAEGIDKKQMLAWEKELLGLYVSGHPLEMYAKKLEGKPKIADVKKEIREGTATVIAGIIAENKTILTKNGDKMAFIRFADLEDSIEAVAFPRILEEHGESLEMDSCALLKGRISKRNGEVSFIIEAVKAL